MDIPMIANVPVSGGTLADLATAVKTVVSAGTPLAAKFEIKSGPTGETRTLVVSWTRTITDVP